MVTWEYSSDTISVRLAGFKLPPALQQIYSSAATIKGSISLLSLFETTY